MSDTLKAKIRELESKIHHSFATQDVIIAEVVTKKYIIELERLKVLLAEEVEK